MPQYQVIDTTERAPEPNGVERFFSKVASTYQEQKGQNALDKILKEHEQNRENENNFENTVNRIRTSRDLTPSQQAEAIKVQQDTQKIINEQKAATNAKYKAFHNETVATNKANEAKTEKKRVEDLKTQKETEVRDRHQASIKQQYLDAGVDEATAERDSKVDSAVTAAAKVRELIKKNNPKQTNGPKEKFEQVLAGEAAKEVPGLEREIKKSADLLANVDTAEKIANENLAGPIGYGKAFFNTESASTLETLGATNLGSVIKLFNPAGTLPTAKLNWIKKTFAVSPWDNLSSMKGKFATQRIILNQAIVRAKERMGLLKQYFGNIPTDIADQFDKETGDILDALEEQIEPKLEKDAHKGKVQIADPNGVMRWVPKEVADKLKAKNG